MEKSEMGTWIKQNWRNVVLKPRRYITKGEQQNRGCAESMVNTSIDGNFEFVEKMIHEEMFDKG